MLLVFLVFFPFLGAFACLAAGSRSETARDYLADLITIIEFVMTVILLIGEGGSGAAALSEGRYAVTAAIGGLCDFGLSFCADGFRLLYICIAALMWMMTTILSREYFVHHGNRNRFYFFLLLTLGATMGVFLSAELSTTFIFFEIMSFTSYVWVAQEENAAALRAADTYLAVAVLGGMVMLMGVFLLYHELGTLEIRELLPAAQLCEHKSTLYVAGACMAFGFGAKAGAFPLHIWLPKAHPVAPAPASALLSGILTKTGIYGILVLTANLFLHDAFWGKWVLILGVLTMFGGAFLAVFSIDLKRTLACSSMSQIGFILVGVGMQCLLAEENALAVHGTFLHMANHSLIKLVLFMAAGVVYMNTHVLDLNRIRGFGRKKPLLKVIFLAGALAIGGIPMFSGYVSKTLLHESIVEYIHMHHSMSLKLVEYIFLFSGGLTVAYMTKLFVAIFVEKNEDAAVQLKYDGKKNYMNIQSTFALGGSAVILFLWGILPGRTMDAAAEAAQGFMKLEEAGHAVHYFTLANLKGAAISISIGAVVYLLFIRKALMKEEKGVRRYIDLWPAWLDLENLLYRPLLLTVLPTLCAFPYQILAKLEPVFFVAIPAVAQTVFRVLDTAVDGIVVGLRCSIYRDSPLPHERPEGTFLTEMLGKMMNGWSRLLNCTIRRGQPVSRDYVHILAMQYKAFKESNFVIYRSISFGLMLAGIGFCLTLIYLLLA